MRRKHCLLGVLVSLLLTGGEGILPARDSLKPQKVQFQSRNFQNILQWQRGKALTGNNSTYFVQYKMYGQRQWQNKEDCWGTPELFCDLTNETSNLQEPYYARVRMASAGRYSDWSLSPRFFPWWEMKIDPPVVNITQINGSSWVVLHAPHLPYKEQKGKNISMENYYNLLYRVFIIKTSLGKEQQVYEGANGVSKIEGLTPHSGYCVVAEIYLPLLDRRSQRSKERCVGTP
ncbi:interleukin-22 receptor subunit alpha-2 [Callospermophilus lateralis]|uniref:interleukin-22 receptor subunit alpha-2 n=1 Tax=Callospermophilus lateralis TaxID=76772 RepID=UPI00403880E5